MAQQKTTKTDTADSAVLSQRASQVQRGGARAAVLGVNDGLVSVLCITLGVAGAHAKPSAVLLAGVAGLIAGAISMAAGEWISVTSQVELFNGVLADLKHMVQHHRSLLTESLSDSYVKSGLTKSTAEKAVTEIAKRDRHLYREYAAKVVGLNPDELGSPWTATLSSLALFTLGGLTPLVPWFFGGGRTVIGVSIGLTVVGGLAVGAYVGRSSGNSPVKGALRQLFIIVLASVVTYGIGHLFGTTIS